jgi:dUTP pyrophosphatase
MTTIQLKKLNPAIELPKYQTKGSAGLDLQSTIEAILPAGSAILVPTGIAIALEQGYEAQIRPRSGLALKHSITVLNSPGTIDCDYRGEIAVILINHGKQDFTISKGLRIAQMVITKCEQAIIYQVDELDATERGSGGFGSTGC